MRTFILSVFYLTYATATYLKTGAPPSIEATWGVFGGWWLGHLISLAAIKVFAPAKVSR